MNTINTITESEARKMVTDERRQAVYDVIRKATGAGYTAVVIYDGLDVAVRNALESDGYRLDERRRNCAGSVWIVRWD